MCLLNTLNLLLSLSCSQSPPPDTELKTNHAIHHALDAIELYLSKGILLKIPVIWKWLYSPGETLFILKFCYTWIHATISWPHFIG